MQFGDYSPPPQPTPDQQRDALRKGLGRAMQWARAGRLEDGPLLEACLCDGRFDHQCEAPRGAWLWRIVQAAGGERRLRVPILHALYDMSDEDSADQICELARGYAESGDETFRDLLYQIVERRPFEDVHCLGEEEIVALDGEKGFLFAARIRGRELTRRVWEWHDGCLVDDAIEKLGEERVIRALDMTTDPAVRRFREGWRRDTQEEKQSDPSGAYRERMQAVTIETILCAAEGKDGCYWFRGWGRWADEADVRRVLEHLWAEQRPKVIANLLKVFAIRPLPEFDARLIELTRHGDEEVERWARNALEENRHPLVREFALKELERGTRGKSPVGFLINNYEPGDEERILEALNFPDDACLHHWLLMDVIQVLEKNPEADGLRLGLISYTSTPCELCRHRAAKVLHRTREAPEWLLEECRYDSDEETRNLVAALG